eukprot:TRINITY_DN8579_c0_g2_i2.p2 TRINITY_DN8579_c0_g2~~TRINITY_DN8579_c0_g2_i2.p2  ORF type:complete len:139 (+),score=7.40 TRINITY_DN8579_c0_g2_i2:52-468(+)
MLPMATAKRGKRRQRQTSLDWFQSSFSQSSLDQDDEDIIEIKEIRSSTRFKPSQLLRRTSSSASRSADGHSALSDISRERKSKLAVHVKKTAQLRQWLLHVYAALQRRTPGSRTAVSSHADDFDLLAACMVAVTRVCI